MATPLEAQLVEIGVAARDRLSANTFLSVNGSYAGLIPVERLVHALAGRPA